MPSHVASAKASRSGWVSAMMARVAMTDGPLTAPPATGPGPPGAVLAGPAAAAPLVAGNGSGGAGGWSRRH